MAFHAFLANISPCAPSLLPEDPKRVPSVDYVERLYLYFFGTRKGAYLLSLESLVFIFAQENHLDTPFPCAPDFVFRAAFTKLDFNTLANLKLLSLLFCGSL